MMSAISVDFGCGCGCAAPQRSCNLCGPDQGIPLRPNISEGQPMLQPFMQQPAMEPLMPEPPMSGSQNPSGLSCRQLMDLIDQASFAMDEAVLYLDTHPEDQRALNYYHQVIQMRHNALEAYHQNFGPLLADHVHATNEWTWINGPWPWEGGCVCGDMKNACNTR